MKTKSSKIIIFFALFSIINILFGCSEDDSELGDKPVAGFISNQTSINIGTEIQFTDESTNNPISWLWDFGDGSSSTLKNPSHIYNSTGVFSISLTVTNNIGSDKKTRTDYISVIESNTKTLVVKMVDNALNGDLGQIGSEVTLSPSVYSFEIESSTAKFGTTQSAWEGAFLYTHEKLSDGQPAPNLMTSLNGIGNIKTIDLSNYSNDITIQGFMIPNVPTYDDSGEVKIIIEKTN